MQQLGVKDKFPCGTIKCVLCYLIPPPIVLSIYLSICLSNYMHYFNLKSLFCHQIRIAVTLKHLFSLKVFFVSSVDY